jgi:hypothetical protein
MISRFLISDASTGWRPAARFFLLQIFASRRRKRPFVEEVLLIDEVEQDVVTGRRRLRRHGRERWLSQLRQSERSGEIGSKEGAA